MPIEFKVPPFPIDMFSGDIRNFVKDSAKSLSCPIDFMGVFVLTVMANGIGSSRVIKIKDGWKEPPVLFTGIVAPPASKKSPAFKLALKPIFEIQKEMKLKYKKEKEIYDEEMERWESDKKSNSKPSKPMFGRNYVNDSTMEGLAKILSNNPKGVFLGLDELSAWIKSMDQYRGGKGADKDKWLSLWSSSPIYIDRSSQDEPIVIEFPCVNVTGGIQPDRLRLLQSKEQDGFIERLLLTFPEPVDDEWVEEGVSAEVRQRYLDRYRALYNLKPETLDDGSLKPLALEFSPQAREFWINFYKVNCDEIKHESNINLKAAFKKIEAYCARFSLIVQLMSYPESKCIDKEAVEIAVALAEYFKAHTRKIYAYIKNEKVDVKTIHVINKIKSQGGIITLREMVTSKVAGCKNAKMAMGFFKELKEKGYGLIVKNQRDTGGKPTYSFHLNEIVSAVSNEAE